MMDFKYILLECEPNPETGIAFPPWIQHDAMAKLCATLGKPIGAGSIKIANGVVSCFGRSHSLQLHAKPEDAIHFEWLTQ